MSSGVSPSAVGRVFLEDSESPRLGGSNRNVVREPRRTQGRLAKIVGGLAARGEQNQRLACFDDVGGSFQKDRGLTCSRCSCDDSSGGSRCCLNCTPL